MGLGYEKTVGERGGGDLSRIVRFEMIDGSRIKFLNDVWRGDQTLKVAFLVLFSIP